MKEINGLEVLEDNYYNILGGVGPYVKSDHHTEYEGYRFYLNGVVIDSAKQKKVSVYQNGYARLRRSNGKMVSVYMATLYGTLFVPNPHRYNFLKFADGDKTNFAVDNMQWVRTHRPLSQNTQDILTLEEEGLSVNEIASSLGIASQQVSKVIRRARNL